MDTKYIILNWSEVDKINFDEIKETSIDTLRKSIDENKTLIKWSGENPSFYDSLETKSQIYSLEEILDILETNEWKSDYQIIQAE
jgi:hypothetical protein